MSNKIAYITMVSASSYYFDSNAEHEGEASLMTAMNYAYIKNFGSLALGSLILTLISVLDMIINSS
jgi:hypothetical protein